MLYNFNIIGFDANYNYIYFERFDIPLGGWCHTGKIGFIQFVFYNVII